MSQGRRQPMDVRKVRPPTAPPAAKPNPFAQRGKPAPGMAPGTMLRADRQGNVLPGAGTFPLAPGTMIDTNHLTPAEQAMLDKMNWKKGEPIPSTLPDMVAQIMAESEPDPEELPPGVDPRKAPIQPKMIDFGQLSPEKQQELVDAMHTAKAQYERIASLPRVDGANPGVNEALATAHGMGGPEIVLRKDKQPSQPHRPPPMQATPPIDINRQPGDLRIKAHAQQSPQVAPPQWANSTWATPQAMRQRKESIESPARADVAHCHVPPQQPPPPSATIAPGSCDPDGTVWSAEQIASQLIQLPEDARTRYLNDLFDQNKTLYALVLHKMEEWSDATATQEPQEATEDDDMQPEPDGYDTGAALHNCPHCGWDLAVRADEIEVDRGEKMAFLMATLGAPDQRFTRSVDLLGGRIKAVFRTLTTKEADMIRTQMRHDVGQSRFDGPGGQWASVVSMAEYRLAASLDSIEYPGLGKSQAVPPIEDVEPDEGQPTGLPNMVRFVNENLVPQEYLRSAVARAFATFQLKVEKLEANMDNPDFWEGIGGQP